MVGDNVAIRIDPESSRFPTGSIPWQREREELLVELQRALPDALSEGKPEPTDKGLPLVPIIVALGGAGVFKALTKCLDSWLQNRTSERSVRIVGTVGGKPVDLSVTAQNIRADGLVPLVKAMTGVVK